MKKLTVRSLILGLLLGLFLMQPWTTPTVKADAIGQCGMPYKQAAKLCFLLVFCWDMGSEACVDCTGGTYCYPMY
jgi:hypothetical protein